MAESDFQLTTKETGIVELVTIALTQECRAGISEMLRVVAQAVGADGCILWQVAPFSRLNQDPPSGQLFVLAEWFSGTIHYNAYNVSLESATGEAILQNQIVNVDDVNTDPRIDPNHSIHMRQLGIRCFCSIPIKFLEGEPGALNAYRTSGKPFTPEEIQKLEELVQLLPRLYQAIVDKVSYHLVLKVNGFLQKMDKGKVDATAGKESFKRTAEQICQAVAKTFQAIEVSLFLSDESDPSGLYTLMATTWPDKEGFKKKEYRASEEEGLSGWVLAHQDPVRIFDLNHFKHEYERLRDRYSGLVWKDQLQMAKSVRRFLAIPEESAVQPLSFMGVPILAAGRLLGVIRCCTAKEGPYYFSEQDVKLLSLVSDHIGQAWNTWLSHREIEEENCSWQRFLGSMGELNRFMQKQVMKENAHDETSIFHKALKVSSSVIQGAEISDVRLLDKERRELYFEVTNGKAWNQGSSEEIKRRRARRFPVDGNPPTSGGAYVVQTKKVYVIPNTRSPDVCYFSETFPETRRMIIAPIGVGEDVFGILDIRGMDERTFPRNAAPIAELLGQQLGLYHHLVKTIAERQHDRRQQARTFEDFTHQLKTPIFQFHAWLEERVRQNSPVSKNELIALRGLAAKAKRVSRSLGLFADLARDKSISLKPTRLIDDYLIKSLIEMVVDQKSTLDPNRRVYFQVERESFMVLREWHVEADKDLLFHVVSNLLDNAAKYSYARTTVYIRGGFIDKERWFQFSVVNKGLPITASEIEKCTQRGWRSESAKAVTGEGSGIGLWIAHHIMRAHGGELRVMSTNEQGQTEVRLLFPVKLAGYRKESRDDKYFGC